MMSRHFRLSSELTGAIAKRLPHAKNQLSTPCSFFNQFVTDIYISYILKLQDFFFFFFFVCLSVLIEELASRRDTKIGM